MLATPSVPSVQRHSARIRHATGKVSAPVPLESPKLVIGLREWISLVRDELGLSETFASDLAPRNQLPARKTLNPPLSAESRFASARSNRL